MTNSNILIPYENKWVALTKDRKKVLANAVKLKELERKLKKIRSKDVVISYILPFNYSYSP